MHADGSERGGRGIAILGGGAAAFAAAIQAAEGGAAVTLIEAGTPGGTCVNTGCVPSKIMIRGAQLAHQQAHHPFQGVAKGAPVIDRARMVAQQQERVAQLRHARYERRVASDPRIALRRGRARFADAHTLKLTQPDGTEATLAADRILIATGRSPDVADTPGLSGTPFWTSEQALVTHELPRHLIVYGASAVGVELAQAFLRLGAGVTLIARSTVLSREDPALGAALAATLAAEGMRVLTHTTIRRVRHDRARFAVDLSRGEPLEGDRLLVATGRRPNTAGLGLESLGVKTANDGAIVVDSRLRTSIPHIYAAGDCTTLPQYVYVAAAAGRHAAINMLGGDAALDLSIVPAVTFTDPQVATVGLSEATAKAQGLDAESRTLALDEIPRALVNFETTGFVKLVAERRSGRLLGAQVFAPEAGEMIQSAALALRAQMTVRDIADQLFPYLTMVEGLKLCALAFFGDVKKLSCCAG